MKPAPRATALEKIGTSPRCTHDNRGSRTGDDYAKTPPAPDRARSNRRRRPATAGGGETGDGSASGGGESRRRAGDGILHRLPCRSRQSVRLEPTRARGQSEGGGS